MRSGQPRADRQRDGEADHAKAKVTATAAAAAAPRNSSANTIVATLLPAAA